jgi:hypothetical protein
MNLHDILGPTLIVSALMVGACGGTETTTNGADAASTGSAGSSGVTGTGGNTGTGGVDMTGAGGSATGSCSPACIPERTCCAGKCVNPMNDPTNCGGCGVQCKGPTPYCEGMCQATPCDRDGGCGNGSCCGSNCCLSGDLCCSPQGPLDQGPVCYTPTADQPTCPQGCAPLCISDRSLKRDIEPIDRFAVLDTVSRLPISTWSYKTDPSVRHMGPMAQDFKAAFGLGDTDRGYYSVDAHGVTIAAIQALYERSVEQSRKIDDLERENGKLRHQLEALDGSQRR